MKEKKTALSFVFDKVFVGVGIAVFSPCEKTAIPTPTTSKIDQKFSLRAAGLEPA